MIHSMTAYSQLKTKGDWGTSIWEIRSVNQRYLEIYLRLPDKFRNLEPTIRDRIRSCLTRGKIECMLHFEENNSSQQGLILNKKFAKKLISAAKWVKTQSGEGAINLVDILRWSGVIVTQDKNLDKIASEIILAFEDTLSDFIATREVEGKELRILIEQRLLNLSAEVEKVRSHMPKILQWQRDRLINKLKSAMLNVENGRLEQELILMAQRVDISEELDRITAHIKEINNLLENQNVAIGRRLDFMMQELNRESNTLASKAINIDITNSAIELKVLIEQMREQIQNIE